MDKFFNELGQETNEKGEVNMENKLMNNEVGFLNAGIFESLVQQANAMQEMYLSMVNIKDEMQFLKTDIDTTKDEVKNLHKEVMDNVYLSSPQFDEISVLLKDATVKTVNSLYGYDLDYASFNKAYKRVVMRFWSLLKKHCDNVSRGREIKRKDYDKAKDFASSLGVSSFVLSFGKRGVPSL
jgi:hypothetical protein